MPGTTDCEPTVAARKIAGVPGGSAPITARCVEERVVVRERRSMSLEVVLVAAVGLDAVDAERDERLEPPLELRDDRRVAEVEHLVAGSPSGAPG